MRPWEKYVYWFWQWCQGCLRRTARRLLAWHWTLYNTRRGQASVNSEHILDILSQIDWFQIVFGTTAPLLQCILVSSPVSLVRQWVGSGEAMELMMEGGGREAVLRAYDELLLTHPELPRQLRDFQVACATYWGLLCHNLWFCRSIYCAVCWILRRKGTLCAPSPLATGKVCQCSSLASLCPKVDPKIWNLVIILRESWHLIRVHWRQSWLVLPPITGSTVIIVVPLHTIEAQLVLECERLGIPAMAGSQVNLKSSS